MQICIRLPLLESALAALSISWTTHQNRHRDLVILYGAANSWQQYLAQELCTQPPALQLPDIANSNEQQHNYDMQTCWRSFSFSNVPSASIDRVFFINASIRTMIFAGGANEDSTTKSAIVRPSIVVIVVLTKYLAEVIGLLPVV